MITATLEILFAISAALVLYTYAGYPILLALLAKIHTPKPIPAPPAKSLSVIIAAKNEAANIARRTTEFLQLLAATKLDAELIIISDGSTDATVAAIRNAAESSPHKIPTHIIDLPASAGKASAIPEGAQLATKEILVFADARQSWHKNALPLLLEKFSDQTIGAVSGDLILESAPGVMAGVGAYWRYEKWLRNSEGKFHSMVGATGAISACRKTLFRPIPPGTILDDVHWPLNVALQHRRVVQVKNAHAYDRLPEKAHDEFRRKVRTLSGNFQLALRLPAALVPFKNPIWLQYVSHKLLRLLVPWLLLLMLAVCALIPTNLFRAILIAQLLFLLLAALGMLKSIGARSKLASAAGSFLVLNAAAFIAFFVFITGRSARSWNKTQYAKPAPAKIPDAPQLPTPEPAK